MGKKLQKAPVYFVIAQVQFNQIMALESYAPQIQDSFRKNGYPDSEHSVVNVLNIGFGAAPVQVHQSAPMTEIKQYSFYNIDRTENFVLSQDRFSFQTTQYDVFEEFSKKFIDGLKLVHDTIQLNFVARTGLRYLDAVVPKDGEKVSKYLNEHVLGLNEKSLGQLSHSFSETVYKSNDVSVTARAVTLRGHLGVPPDLQPMPLNFLDRFKSVNGVHTILDTDGSISQRNVFELKLIGAQLVTIHEEITRTFKATVTPAALEAWA